MSKSIATTGASYEAELRGLITTRTRLVFLLGFIVSVAAIPAAILFDAPSIGAADAWRHPTMYLHAVSFAFGLLIVRFVVPDGTPAWLAAAGQAAAYGGSSAPQSLQ